MKRIHPTIYCLACAFVLAATTGTARAAEFKLPASDATAAELVDAALRSELDGPSEQRKTLLDQALSLDPNYAPARWQSGYVRWDDQWLTLDEVAKVAGDDKRLAAYRQRRDRMIDRADDHRELARWCKKNQLFDEARVHWAKVLEFDPADAEALTALDLQLYEGRLLTKQQIIEAKQQAGERMRALRRWQPQMVKWRKGIEIGRGIQYVEAIEALSLLDDVVALEVLEATFAENGSGKQADALNLALIKTAGHIPTPEATQVLLRRAIQPDSEAVRAAACDELKKRPMYAYVPQLIAAIPGKIKTRFNIFVLPNGMVLHEHEILIEGSEANISLAYSSTVSPADNLARLWMTPRALANETRVAATIEASAMTKRTQQEQKRRRVEHALARTTGFESTHEPALWEKQYNDEFGWATRPESKQTMRYSYGQTQGYFQAPTRTVFENHSCFPAGTPVQTILGPRPIETLQIGDRVLSQDLVTGELVYAPIQKTTLRQGAPQRTMETDAGIITATIGHPFWVAKSGWLTVQQLKLGMALHGIDGPQRIADIRDAPATEAYNLVVSGFHNYFVGPNCLLVHDNSPILECDAEVPGLTSN